MQITGTHVGQGNLFQFLRKKDCFHLSICLTLLNIRSDRTEKLLNILRKYLLYRFEQNKKKLSCSNEYIDHLHCCLKNT